MVVLVDLDQDELHKPYHAVANDLSSYFIQTRIHGNQGTGPDRGEGNEEEEEEEVEAEGGVSNPNLNSFSEALGCYPIVTLLARKLDLNSLHDLSRTCRQFRVNLLQYRRQLISQTLRCENEDDGSAANDHQSSSSSRGGGARIPRLTSGKIGKCARDMVGECRCCSKIICRNCIVKAPAPSALKGRHRRLCRTCIKSPLEEHTRYIVDDQDYGDDSSTTASTDERQHQVAIARDPCSCAEQVWICQPCGQSLRTSDTAYMRGWTWRTRYSTYLGGLGTGIGEGVEGVQCGRHSYCLSAKDVEKEIDCDADELEALQQLATRAGMEGRTWSGASYLMQEMEGIGGVVKKKVKKRVRVGAVVKEYEDERDHGTYLGREQDGQSRSWCSWCNRVIMGKKDLEMAHGEGGGDDALRRTISRSSSASSV